MDKFQPAAMFLRADGSFLVTQGDVVIELVAAPAELLQFAIDAMRIATKLDSHLMDAAAHALANTYVLPSEAAPTCPKLN